MRLPEIQGRPITISIHGDTSRAMAYYAHTANGPDGKPDTDQRHWQPLSTHLRNVATLAQQFAAPLGLSAEAELAGLLHDLGKYAERFQARLDDNSIHGINHWAAGAAHAAELRFHNSAFAVDGHHTGMPARDGDGLKQTIDWVGRNIAAYRPEIYNI